MQVPTYTRSSSGLTTTGTPIFEYHSLLPAENFGYYEISQPNFVVLRTLAGIEAGCGYVLSFGQLRSMKPVKVKLTVKPRQLTYVIN